ncbi:MAG TPA: hypothetical protein VJ734_08000 [Nitrosospira sp.]|nr:hypothetical protein [Nitrosospira sp.]
MLQVSAAASWGLRLPALPQPGDQYDQEYSDGVVLGGWMCRWGRGVRDFLSTRIRPHW